MFKGYMWHMSKALQPHIRKSRMHISLEVDEVWGQWNSFALHICLTDCFGCFILRISHIITLHFHCIYSSSLASLASFSQIHVLYFNNVYVCSTKSNQCCIYRYTHVYICVCFMCVRMCEHTVDPDRHAHSTKGLSLTTTNSPSLSHHQPVALYLEKGPCDSFLYLSMPECWLVLSYSGNRIIQRSWV